MATLALPAVASGTPTMDTIHHVDALTLLRALPDNSVNCVVTSPPYFGLRDYGVPGQIGLEPTPREFVATMVAVFAEVRRVLRDDGTCWLNLGDSYAHNGDLSEGGSAKQRSNHGANAVVRAVKMPVREKNLLGIPWRVAFALQDDGWYLRSDIIWAKPNPMPESVQDRPTKSHEYVFLLTKSADYWYDADAIREPAIRGDANAGQRNYRPGTAGNQRKLAGQIVENDRCERNARTVWTIATEPTPFAHFATYPKELVRRCVLAGCPVDGLVLDPFMGSGTTALVARSLGRHYLGCDLNEEYVKLARERLRKPFEAHHMEQVTRIADLPLFATIAP